MWKTKEGSTGRLLQLCIGYFIAYVGTGIVVKYFTGGIRDPKMGELTYLFNNTLGGSLVALSVVVLLGWVRLKSNEKIRWLGMTVPSEIKYIIPSGICTAVVIPTTTLMYSLPISVMVAMVIMRGSVIVISRVVDSIQIRQGILKKKVYAEENWAVLFALLAVGTNVVLLPLVDYLDSRGISASRALGFRPGASKGSFDFLGSTAAMTIMGLYIVAYSIRIYIMNFFKNTRAKGVPQDNKGFFAIEQLAASGTMVLLALFFITSPGTLGWTDPRILEFREAAFRPDLAAILSGIPFGVVAFFSVFIFMFKGRTATFAGLVNRLTSLLAGTFSTLLLYWIWKTSPPKIQDWVSFAFIMIAVWFLTRAEKRRAEELGVQSAAAEAAIKGPAVAPAR
jgi:hypothetical protein